MAESSVAAYGRAGRAFAALSLGWLALDQFTKALIAAGPPAPAVIKQIIPGWLEITHSRNPGAAFGMLNQHDWARWLFAAVAVAALAAIISRRHQILALPWPQWVGLALVAAGAAGNLCDRVFRGGLVVDFIRVYLPTGHATPYLFPDFNVADTGVTCGIVLYVAHTLYCDWRQRPEAATHDAA